MRMMIASRVVMNITMYLGKEPWMKGKLCEEEVLHHGARVHLPYVHLVPNSSSVQTIHHRLSPLSCGPLPFGPQNQMIYLADI